MRMVALLGLAALPALLFAQRAPLVNVNRETVAPSGAYRYGNILFPGGIPQNRGGFGPTTTKPYTGVPPGYHGRGNGGSRNRTVVVPYAYPVFYGGGYYQEPNVTVVMPQQPPPTVIINNTYAQPEHTRPGMKEYSSEGTQESGLRVYDGSPQNAEKAEKPATTTRSALDEKANIYFIALKDGSLRQAIGYWVKDSALHFVTPNSSMDRVPLDMLDNQRSVEINAERKLEFNLDLPR